MLDSIWECTVIVHNEELDDLPNGADWPPRKAAVEAIESLGLSIHSVSSGWGCEEFTPKIAALKRRVASLEGECVEKSNKIVELEKRIEQLTRSRNQFGQDVDDLSGYNCPSCGIESNALVDLRREIAALKATCKGRANSINEMSSMISELQESNVELKTCGTKLSNLAFNLKQDEKLSADMRALLTACQGKWDALLRGFRND
jgi:prefoldin subunit 5